MTDVTVFAHDCATLTVTDKKGTLHGITPEGAVFRGGVFLTALKDAALDSALTKATGGRYRAASDILCAAFPSIGKAADKLIGTPWANKSSFATLTAAVLRAEPKEGKDFSDKQHKARALARAWERSCNLDNALAEALDMVEAQ